MKLTTSKLVGKADNTFPPHSPSPSPQHKIRRVKSCSQILPEEHKVWTPYLVSQFFQVLPEGLGIPHFLRTTKNNGPFFFLN